MEPAALRTEPTEQRGDAPTADDDALLREVLEFIGDLESEDEPLLPLADEDENAHTADSFPKDAPNFIGPTPQSQVSQAPTSTTEAAVPPLDLVWPAPGKSSKAGKSRGNPSRTRRRLELLYLRQVVGDLESQLKQLQQKADESQFQSQLDECEDDAEQKRPSAFVSAWRHVASRQFEERQRALKENVKLKRLLHDQIQIGKSLERLLLRKRPTVKDIGTRGHIEKRARVGSVSISWDSQQIFRDLLESIESQKAETTRVLEKVRHDDKTNYRNIELVHDDILGMLLETTESYILPFEYELVIHEFWSAIPGHTHARISDTSDDEHIKTQFRAHATYGRTNCDFTIYMADRRIREGHRTVFLTAGFFQPSKIADVNMSGMYQRHRSWVVFEQVPMETKVVTKMTSYMVTFSEVFEGLEDRAHKVGTLTDFSMSALAIELEMRQQALENRLFDRSISCVM